MLVYHDLLGLMHHPHHEKHVPSFCKRYAMIGQQIHTALLQYKQDVYNQTFPSEEYSPYKMSSEEQQKFSELLTIDEENRKKEQIKIKTKLKEADEYEVVKLY